MTSKIRLRGQDAKIAFCEKYDILCIGRFLLLPGQIQTCCCGRKDITSEYLRFSYTYPGRKDESGIICAGPGCGKDIARYANIDIPPYFSLFSENKIHNDSDGHHENKSQINEYKIKFSPLNKEVYISLSIIFSVWTNLSDGPMKKCFEFIIKNPEKDAFPSYIRTINKNIKTISDQNGINPSVNNIIKLIAERFNKTPRVISFNNMKNVLSNNFPDDIIYL